MFPIESIPTSKIDERRGSLDIPTHGRIPHWLQDMSGNVELSQSLIIDKNNFLIQPPLQPRRQQLESKNNQLLTSFSTDEQQFNRALMLRSSTSTPVTSAKYGRRASTTSQVSELKKQTISENMDTYLIPTLDQINFRLVSNGEFDSYGFRPVYKNISDNSVKLDSEHISPHLSPVNTSPLAYPVDELQSYSPSILERNKSGRRSKLEISDEQLISQMQDLRISEPHSSSMKKDLNPKHFKSKSMPEDQIYLLEKITLQPTKNPNHERLFIRETPTEFSIKEPLNLAKEFNSEAQEIAKNVSFDNEFLLINKIQKSKRTKYNQRYKYRHGSNKKKKQNIQELPRAYSANKEELSYTLNNTGSEIITESNAEEILIIPELPSGVIMIIDILSTWGDRYYVGLNGIELFDSDGNLVQVKKIFACPEDINILPECSGDPRIVTNLLDGVNRTQDDMHLWLAPYEAGEHHLITMEFVKKTELAMLRIWNYNKSRIHSFRGARDVVITLDGVCIFRGEIAQACGSILGGIESFGDTILFTTNESILEKIALNDISYSTLISVSDRQTPENTERPTTATADEGIRPYTHALSQKHESPVGDQLFGAQRLDLVLILNWGKIDYIGLTGLEIIGDSDISITISKENLRSNNLTSGAMLGRLIDDENITIDRKHMWYTQYMPGEEIILSVIFDKLTYVSGIRIWNYNENLEMTFAGVRLIKIFLDNKPMINPNTNDTTFLLRRAPGNTHYDYVQEIRFCHSNTLGTSQEAFYDLNNFILTKEDIYDNPIMPEGFVFQFVIYTTWGDQYYVGLNGLEIFDQNGKKVVLTESNICAHPESVNVLPGVSGDIRTPDKLIDGINDRNDGTHSWLAPIVPKCLNRIYIVFDQPIAISVIKIWNYYKSPARGVKEFGILVDDLLVYNGILDKACDKYSVKYRTIPFTNDRNVLQKEMASLVKHSIDSQATILMNDETRMTTGGSLPNVDQSLRPFTSVNYLNRARTSQSN